MYTYSIFYIQLDQDSMNEEISELAGRSDLCAYSYLLTIMNVDYVIINLKIITAKPNDAAFTRIFCIEALRDL